MKLHRIPGAPSSDLRGRLLAAGVRARADPPDQFGLLPFDGFPYLVTALVGPLQHLIVLPGSLDLPELTRIAWRQYHANRLRTCLVLSSDAALYLSDDGALLGDPPRCNSPICDQLLSSEPFAVSVELRARQERLRAFVEGTKALPSNQGYLVDRARGRQPTPADIELLAGSNAEGVPTGLTRCPACDQRRGEYLWPHDKSLVVRVYCRCENHNRCARCFHWLHERRLEACYFDQRERKVLWVPAFCGLSHRCPSTSSFRGRPPVEA